MSRPVVLPLILVSLLAGCATSEVGRVQWRAPEPVGAVYSDLEVQARLAMTPGPQCADERCAANEGFRRRVADSGANLMRAAYARYPDLERRTPRFEFVVPAKRQVGTMSNSSGGIHVLDGLADIDIDDAALNFIIAREMGHVIAGHNDENTALSILVSVAAQMLLPVANLIRGAAAAIPFGTGLAATTAASLVGSRVLKAAYRPEQRDEADTIALHLLRRTGWDAETVARSVTLLMPKLERLGAGGWVGEMQQSSARLAQFDCGLPWLPALANASGNIAATLEARLP